MDTVIGYQQTQKICSPKHLQVRAWGYGLPRGHLGDVSRPPALTIYIDCRITLMDGLHQSYCRSSHCAAHSVMSSLPASTTACRHSFTVISSSVVGWV